MHTKLAHTHFFCDGVDAFIHLEPLLRLAVVLVELLGNIRADVAKPLLDGLCCLEGLLRWDARLSFSQELLNEVGDVAPGDGNVLDTAADDVPLSLGGGGGGRRGRNFNFVPSSQPLNVTFVPFSPPLLCK